MEHHRPWNLLEFFLHGEKLLFGFHMGDFATQLEDGIMIMINWESLISYIFQKFKDPHKPTLVPIGSIHGISL